MGTALRGASSRSAAISCLLNYGTLLSRVTRSSNRKEPSLSAWGVSIICARPNFRLLNGRRQLELSNARLASGDCDRGPLLIAFEEANAEASEIMMRLRATIGSGHCGRDFGDELESILQMHVDDNLHAV